MRVVQSLHHLLAFDTCSPRDSCFYHRQNLVLSPPALTPVPRLSYFKVESTVSIKEYYI